LINFLKLLFILLLLAFPETANAAPSVVLEDMQHNYALGKHLDFFEDKERIITIDDIVSSEISSRWRQSKSSIPNFGFADGAYWVRFSIDNKCSHTDQFYLEVAYPYLDRIDLFIPDYDNFILKKSGDYLPFNNREIANRYFVFPLKIPEGKTTYYLKIDSITGDSVVLPFKLYTSKGFNEKVNFEQTILGIYYGAMLVMIIYNLFLFISLRERVYLYIIWFVGGFLLFQACEDGLATEYLWQNNIFLANYAVFYIIILGSMGMIKFSQEFLDTVNQTPRMHKILTRLFFVLILWAFILTLSIFLQPALPKFIPIVLTFLVFLIAGLLLVCALLGTRNNFRPAKFFLLAETGFLIGVILVALRIACLLPVFFVTEYSAQMGSVMAVVLLSFGLADKVNIIKQEKEEYLDKVYALINSSTDLIFLKDTKLRYVIANKVHETIFNVKVDQIIGKTDFDFMPAADARHCEESDLEALKKGHVSKKETVGDRHYHIIKQKVLHKGKNLIGVAGVIRDITRQRQAEAEKKGLTEQLRQSQKLESIGTLAGGVAHDFNNILTVIIGYTEVAIDEIQRGSSLDEILKEVYKAGLRAKDLVQQILTFARQTDQELKPLRVNTIAREVIKLLQSTLPATIEIKQNIASDSLIMADPTQIYQVMMNLCTNAAHAMDEHGGTLEITVTDEYLSPKFVNNHPGLEPGHFLQVAVKDTGTGIKEEVIDSIFEPYFTTKERGEGTGLGLSVVHGIVKGYGGEILVENNPGKGAKFRVYLPIIEIKDEENLYQSQKTTQGNEHILIIEDEPPIAKMYSRMLTKLGYTVTSRTSSLEALELFQKRANDFDIVISDMTMPQMTGDKLASEMLKIRPDTPFILCTGYSKNISEEKAKEIGIKYLIMKPIIQKEIAEKIRKALDEQTKKK
jgi:PAS domain S-box-containing protein